MTGAAIVAALALTATPARVQLDGAGTATVQIANHGRQPVVLDVSRAGFALDLSGRPRIVPAAPPTWLALAPRRVAIAPGGSAAVRVTARVPRGAAPGDHAALALLASRALARGSVAVRVRLGLVVLLRVPGRIVHHLAATALRVRGRTLRLRLENRGNVAEAPVATVTLWRRGRLVARLHVPAAELLPRTARLIPIRPPRRFRGPLVARVGLGAAQTEFRVRL